MSGCTRVPVCESLGCEEGCVGGAGARLPGRGPSPSSLPGSGSPRRACRTPESASSQARPAQTRRPQPAPRPGGRGQAVARSRPPRRPGPRPPGPLCPPPLAPAQFGKPPSALRATRSFSLSLRWRSVCLFPLPQRRLPDLSLGAAVGEAGACRGGQGAGGRGTPLSPGCPPLLGARALSVSLGLLVVHVS